MKRWLAVVVLLAACSSGGKADPLANVSTECAGGMGRLTGAAPSNAVTVQALNACSHDEFVAVGRARPETVHGEDPEARLVKLCSQDASFATTKACKP